MTLVEKIELQRKVESIKTKKEAAAQSTSPNTSAGTEYKTNTAAG
jgi:hypothetical protein